MGTTNKMKNNIIKFPTEEETKCKDAIATYDTLKEFYKEEKKPRVNIALLSPRTHAQQPYGERTVIFTDDDAYVKVKTKEGWEAMLRSHYIERTRLDEGPPRVDYSWVRKITEPIYARLRRSRKKY